MQAPANVALTQARRAIDGASTRDRGRLLGLLSKWREKPGDDAARDQAVELLGRLG